MPFDIVREIESNKFLLLLIGEKEYKARLEEIIKSVGKTNGKICYVCLSKPHNYVIKDLGYMGIDSKNFFFIDVLSSHYGKPKPVKNCIFVSAPTELTAIRMAIKTAMEKWKCTVLLFDTVSALLIYQESFSIVRFTHNLMTGSEQEKTKKVFIMLKGDSVPSEENQNLVKDLTMFADKTLDFG
jgi:hypothetical protein